MTQISTPPANPSAKPAGPLLKMKDLCRAAGVTKSTILHYLAQGLLPPPVRTSRNMAYYHPSTVERIAFIKDMQQTHRLPLAAIKGLLKERDQGRDVGALLALQDYVFGSGGEPPMTRREFIKATGLTDARLDELLQAELILPLEDGSFDAQDAAVGKALASAAKLGLKAAAAAFYPRLAREMVEEEMAMRRALTADLPLEEDARATLELTRVARALRAYIIDRMHQRRILRTRGLKDHHPR